MSEKPQETTKKYSSERLQELILLLSPNQLRFVVARQECSTDKEAAQAIEVSVNTVYHWPKIVNEAVQLMADDVMSGAAAIRKRHLAKAMMVKVAALDDKEISVRQKAATEIIEWEMGKASQTVENNMSTPDGPVKVEVTYKTKPIPDFEPDE